MTTPAASFVASLLRIVPPWLRRTVGAKLLRGVGDVLDTEILKNSDGVKARFPVDSPDEGAVAAIGSERRIRRGPGETATNYARRMRRWWEAHKHRGSPYELILQLFGFFHDNLPMRMDVVAQLGDRHWIASNAVDGTVVTHDAVTWEGNGNRNGDPVLLTVQANPGDTSLRLNISSFPSNRAFSVLLSDGVGGSETVTAKGTATGPDRVVLTSPVVGTYPVGKSNAVQVDKRWARLWVFFYVTELFDVLVTDADEVLVTSAGDTLVATSVFSGTISDADAEMFKAIPREWGRAGHIPYVTVVLIYNDPITGAPAELWEYPPTATTWDTDDGSTWDSPAPEILIAD